MGAKSVLACEFEGEEGIKKFGMFLLGKTYNKAGLSEVQQQQKMYLDDLKELCGMLLADPDQIRQSLAHCKAAGTLAVKARTKKDVALDDSEPELHPHTSNINDIPPAYLWALCELFAEKPIPKEAQSAISDKGGKQIRVAFTYFTGLFGTHPVTAELRVKAKFNRYCISLAAKRGKLIDRGNGFFVDCVKGNELDFTHKDHGIFFFSKGEGCDENKAAVLGKVLNKTAADHPLKHMFSKKLAVSSDDLSQQEAKKLLPPKCTVWRANYLGAWMGHDAPHARIHEKWIDHGMSSRRAMLRLMQRLWRQWLSDRNMPESHCPVKGLMSMEF